MKKPVEIALLAAGGVALFGVCFVSFALVAGVPMHGVPVIGALFPEPEATEEDEVASADDVSDETRGDAELPERRNTTLDIVNANIGLLGGFAIPAPFSRGELEELVGDLEEREHELDDRLTAVSERERILEEQLLLLQTQADELDALRDEIDVRAAELELRALELRRDEESFSADEEARLANIATLYEEGDVDQATEDLQQLTPTEAAKVLRHLDEDRALQILRALPGDARRTYAEAWATTDS
ncbi:MAG: MotE family protein [Planctomycetota bacterium]|jgi:flagellar motility protein MotE (MotC chaperone)